MGKRAERNGATSPVVLGFVVVKRYLDRDGLERNKEVSRVMLNKGAAETFMVLCVKYHIPSSTETGVQFYVTEKHGFDDIPGVPR